MIPNRQKKYLRTRVENTQRKEGGCHLREVRQSGDARSHGKSDRYGRRPATVERVRWGRRVSACGQSFACRSMGVS